MKNKVLNYIKENSMIYNNDKILVALSGGPDSVCLLHILNELKTELNINLIAAHVNHCLRGDSALKDEEYVKVLCGKLNIPIYVKKVDINKISKEKGISTEMAGRDERYSFFEDLRKKYNINKIAIAHNANDQAETLIMRAARGTGLEGLVGIKPIRDNLYIRPILCLRRNEIENYCLENNLNPRIDETNFEELYSRNKVRLRAIPFVEENFNKDFITALNRLAYNCSKDVELIEEIVSDKYNEHCKIEKDFIIVKKAAFIEKEAILTRIIRKALMECSKIKNNFEMKHIHDIISLQNGNTGKSIDITNGVIVINEYGNIKIKVNYYNEEIKEKKELIPESITLNKSITSDEKILNDKFEEFHFKIIDEKKGVKFENNSFIKYFDYDKVNSIGIRNRKNGDKIIPLGMKGSKKLKDIFIDNKIPKEERDRIPLLIFNDEIAWVVGVKVSDSFKVNSNTKKILKINYRRKE